MSGWWSPSKSSIAKDPLAPLPAVGEGGAGLKLDGLRGEQGWGDGHNAVRLELTGPVQTISRGALSVHLV